MIQHLWLLLAALICAAPLPAYAQAGETREERDARMAWWRDARFGMFIHWGLYAIPAGEWGKETGYGEWIMNDAQIPVQQYEKLVGRFNPTRFDADEWVRMAKDAGMKYIVITSKHHDGFSLFDSKYTDYDVMSTPFHRDVLKELSDACRRQGIRMCWYHSIMDWHHPDYIPRREWETRSAEGADYDRYIDHVKNQLTELVTHYGDIGVLWFDGGWEHPAKMHRADEIVAHLRALQPGLIINDRLGIPQDFSTPEQYIPPTGIPDRDWETCMTMNNHWGYNKNDQNWKSAEDLIRKLADIASKGGNFLLNVGPTAEGTFPPACVERLKAIGRWMKVNGESIYGTQPSPFAKLAWGRCTRKALPSGDTRLYLHVFDWPAGGTLVLPGLINDPKRALLLADEGRGSLDVARDEDALVIRLPASEPDPTDSVVVLDVAGRADVVDPPRIEAASDIFIDAIDISATSDRGDAQVRWTRDGSAPSSGSPVAAGPIRLTETTTVSARLFRGDRPISEAAQATFTKVQPRPAAKVEGLVSGLDYEYYEGDWDEIPDFGKLTAKKTGAVADFDLSPRDEEDRFGFRYTGYVAIPRTGVYRFFTESDDGSRLYIGDRLVVDNDGLHGMRERSGLVALAAGLHPITVDFFDAGGADGLVVSWQGPDLAKQRLPATALRRAP
jgi:alpha-L-fucosidase